ncbi:DUF3526 domain-containing protein [Aquimarina longa]|uniref:DUF3526 domain-containing protein n=1 Tax=Aquimarina longa TaxID=1080221 RepID=UPI000783B49B|nr:DUF3526 domain-containing protein [Aquimarina longa]
MRKSVIIIIAKQLWKNAFRSKVLHVTLTLAIILITFAAYSGWKNYKDQNRIRNFYQEEARHSWESNPDKHPHRMAHYGSFAFRLKHKLSLFDFGMENYIGNAVFLEAHKQNTINFSEASLSTGLLRFGEINLAMLLKVIFPLLIFYLGFGVIANERENSTLKIMITQGASWNEILFGKSLGLIVLSMLFFIPVMVLTLLFISTTENYTITFAEMLRFFILIITYLLFYGILSIITILVSATSTTAKNSLIKLLGIWLIFIIILPKTLQALGYYLYPTPSKIEFESIVENDLIKEGDSHNPDDAHYKTIRDSVLLANNVTSVDQLPFNYGGFIMNESEKISSAIYNKHQKDLFNIYKNQNTIERFSALINPYTAIKHISMAFSGTDFASYIDFQHQAERYRYQLAQKMNTLQMEFIPNKRTDKPNRIDKSHWKAFPDFKYDFLSIGSILKNEFLSIFSLILWSILSIIIMIRLSKKAKAI